MTQVVTLAADMREGVGKGTARAVRRDNLVPAVIYGNKLPPLPISMDANLLSRYVYKSSFFTHLFDIEISGKKHRVLPRDVQFDAVTDKPLHVDFLRVTSTTKIRVHVPVTFINADKSPGLKRGGALNVVHHELEVLCSPDKIPEKFEVDLDGLQINESIHLSAVKMGEGIKSVMTEKDATIATIAAPAAVRSEIDAAASAAPASAAPAKGGKAPAAAKPAAAPAKPAGKK